MSHSPGTGAIDSYLPTYDVRSAHQIEVHAPARVTYETARDVDVGRSIPIAVLVTIRALPHLVTGKARPSRSLTMKTFLDIGFVILEEDPPREFVIGAVGKFWRPDSGMVRITRDEFRTFDEPGFAKAILTLTVEERGPSRSLLATETRVACTDSPARRKFFLYWRAIGPFSGWIRRLMLEQVKRTAEGP
jgi:hypothetical protein